MQDLVGKVAVVTGGSMGMGLALVQRFRAGGAKVVFCSDDAASIKAAAPEVDGAHGIVANVSCAEDMAQLVSTAIELYGGLDVLANCAGVMRYGTVPDTDEATWDEVMTVNVKGIYLAARYAIPHMQTRGGGSIINIASVQAFASQANVAAYTASKGAIVALTRAMALDHARDKIRVNAICPASIDTPMLRAAAQLWKGEGTAEAIMDMWGQAHPWGRVGTPEEIAEVGAFLASDRCPFMTGADLKVDGGVLAKLGIILPE